MCLFLQLVTKNRVVAGYSPTGYRRRRFWQRRSITSFCHYDRPKLLHDVGIDVYALSLAVSRFNWSCLLDVVGSDYAVASLRSLQHMSILLTPLGSRLRRLPKESPVWTGVFPDGACIVWEGCQTLPVEPTGVYDLSGALCSLLAEVGRIGLVL
jgi:hypothetical protein